MLFSQTRGRPVITASEATSLGTVRSLTVDAADGTVRCLRLADASGHDVVVPWSAIDAIGPDAVMVASQAAVEAASAEAPVHHEVLGIRVLTEHGTEHGTVEDVAYDPSSGRVLTLYTALGEISGDRLLGIGSYALVVRAAPR